jgi:Zn-dependent protease with chaperone function
VTYPPRVHFLDEQRRHRRTGALSAALVVVVLTISVIPLSIMISPLLVAVAAVLLRVADLMMELPAGLAVWLDRVFNLLPTMWAAVRRSDVDLPWESLAGLFILPGLGLTLVLWAIVRLTFRRTGVGGVLRRMETRSPDPGDLAEQRLANLIQEVAVAAAVPPPRVLLIDTSAANAGAAGLRMNDASVIVTRGFVDRLPRDAQQAVIAHVMSSIGNGDLTLAAEILTLLQTWGLITLVLEAAFLPSVRRSLAVVGGIGWRTLRGKADAPSRELAVDHLLDGAGHELDMDSEELEQLPRINPLALMFGYLPLLMTVAVVAIFSKTVIWLTTLLIGPLVALLWRTRRRLADATAVQLTRHPGALAGALRTLSGLDVTVPGAVAVHFLFPVWDPAVDHDHSRTEVSSTLLRMQLPLEARLRRLERLGATVVPPAAPRPPREVVREFASAFWWLTVAALLLAVLLAANVVAAAAVFYGLAWLLNFLLVTLPRRAGLS